MTEPNFIEEELENEITRPLQLIVLLRLQLWDVLNQLETVLVSNLHLTPQRRRALAHLDDIIAEFCSDPDESPGVTAQRTTAEALIAILDDYPPDEDQTAIEQAEPPHPLATTPYNIQFSPHAFTLTMDPVPPETLVFALWDFIENVNTHAAGSPESYRDKFFALREQVRALQSPPDDPKEPGNG